jgi:hypothetical protein
MANETGELPVLKVQAAFDLTKEPADQFRRSLKKYEFNFDSIDEKGKTLLINIVENLQQTTDHLWVVLEYFSDTSIKDLENERTALHYACRNQSKAQIVCLLLFGASTELIDKEGKKPLEYCSNIKDEIEHVMDIIEKIKITFIQLTRKRRKYLKKIFDQIDQSTKLLDEDKLFV